MLSFAMSSAHETKQLVNQDHRVGLPWYLQIFQATVVDIIKQSQVRLGQFLCLT